MRATCPAVYSTGGRRPDSVINKSGRSPNFQPAGARMPVDAGIAFSVDAAERARRVGEARAAP
eukprot:23871-Prymnesium_polylepis.1